jgi:hypothetical protein
LGDFDLVHGITPAPGRSVHSAPGPPDPRRRLEVEATPRFFSRVRSDPSMRRGLRGLFGGGFVEAPSPGIARALRVGGRRITPWKSRLPSRQEPSRRRCRSSGATFEATTATCQESLSPLSPKESQSRDSRYSLNINRKNLQSTSGAGVQRSWRPSGNLIHGRTTPLHPALMGCPTDAETGHSHHPAAPDPPSSPSQAPSQAPRQVKRQLLALRRRSHKENLPFRASN